MDTNKNSHLSRLISDLRKKYGTHRNVARELGITEDWYFQVRAGTGTPSETLVRLMRKILY